MGVIKVTVGNSFLNGVIDEYMCHNVDISSQEEMEYCAEECVGAYLDDHHDLYIALCSDIEFDLFAEACYYLIEEEIEDVE